MARILIVYYSLSGNTAAAAAAVAAGVTAAGGEPVLKTGLEADADDLNGCAALAVGTPDYFSTMAGGLKDFFDRTYYPCKEAVQGKPCGVFVTHGGGGRAVTSMTEMCGHFGLRLVQEPVLVHARPNPDAVRALEALGRALVAAAK